MSQPGRGSYRAGRVGAVLAAGRAVLRVNTCAGLSMANIVYGGKDRKTLYIVDSATGSILRGQMPVAGQTMLGLMD